MFVFLLCLQGCFGASLRQAWLYASNDTGQYTFGGYDTLGGTYAINLYLDTGGPILNPGNGAAVMPNIPLVIGSNTINLRAAYFPLTQFTLQLIFDSTDTKLAPHISAVNQWFSSSAPQPASGLGISHGYNDSVPNAGFTYMDGPLKITLTELYVAYVPGAASKVGGYDDKTPGGNSDLVGKFTLEVTDTSAVPEPSTLALTTGLGVLMGIRRILQRA
ncbi:MAG: PEP-CTERM sorting domain-containing protein [Acidobacteria bacterium]|nr:PEP-CTERM sorting domain-containing protein [Acidobacteriota bacterium]